MLYVCNWLLLVESWLLNASVCLPLLSLFFVDLCYLWLLSCWLLDYCRCVVLVACCVLCVVRC